MILFIVVLLEGFSVYRATLTTKQRKNNEPEDTGAAKIPGGMV